MSSCKQDVVGFTCRPSRSVLSSMKGHYSNAFCPTPYPALPIVGGTGINHQPSANGVRLLHRRAENSKWEGTNYKSAQTGDTVDTL